MAQQVFVQFVDDLDGTASDDISTVQFGLDGVDYEIDLTGVNAENFRKIVAEYVTVARRTGGRLRRGAPSGDKPANSGEAGLIRQWALENGFELASRGRIPGHVAEAYNAATVGSGKRSAKRRSAKKN